jgi:YHS domain-containing protein
LKLNYDYQFGKRPVRGNGNFTASYEGATYPFSCKSNLEAFQFSPKKYALRMAVSVLLALRSVRKVDKNFPAFAGFQLVLKCIFSLGKWIDAIDSFLESTCLHQFNPMRHPLVVRIRFHQVAPLLKPAVRDGSKFVLHYRHIVSMKKGTRMMFV